tara:strand:+ start:260 stop:775 length:516 start_codon:yes stop_codon:yes gene_type:complete
MNEEKELLGELIKKSSPLYDFWNSKQTSQEEAARLALANESSQAVILFIQEPYKWENLYQSIIRELIKGDIEAIKGAQLILNTVNEVTKEQILNYLEENEIIPSSLCEQIRANNINRKKTKFKVIRFLRILGAIFFNPYSLELRGKKKHSYEITGYYIYLLRRFFNQIFNR